MTEYTNRCPWWDPDEKSSERWEPLWNTFHFIYEHDAPRREQDLNHLRLYSNRNILGLGPNNHFIVDPLSNTRISVNVTKSVCDAATVRVGKNKPRPVFLTSGGSFTMQRKAKNLEKFVDLVFYRNRMGNLSPRACLDAVSTGTGFLNVFIMGDEIKIERVFPNELFVDQAEGLYGEPTTMYRQHFVNREVLMAMFPDSARALRDLHPASIGDYRDSHGYDSTADQLMVVSAWHLPSLPGGADGRYAVCVDGLTLLDEVWEYDWFPFVPIRWTDSQLGFWGSGIIEEIKGIQTEITRTVQAIQKAHKKLSVPWVLVEQASKVNEAHINNDIGAIIKYSGTPPIVKPNETVSAEVYAYLRTLISWCYELPGLSADFSHGEKPAGVTSAIGVRTASAREASRFALFSQQYEQMHLEVAKRVVAYGKKLNKSVTLQKDKYTIEQIDWSEVEIPEDEYVLKVYPASSLPDDPAGRLDFVQDMINAGMVTPERGKMLLGFPDIDQDMQLDRAAHDFIGMALEKILSEGVYVSVEPFMDLDLALKMGQAHYNRAMTMKDVPPERMEMLRSFMLQAKDMKDKAALELARAQAGAMGQMNPSQSLTAAPGPVNPDGSQPGAVGSADVSMIA